MFIFNLFFTPVIIIQGIKIIFWVTFPSKSDYKCGKFCLSDNFYFRRMNGQDSRIKISTGLYPSQDAKPVTKGNRSSDPDERHLSKLVIRETIKKLERKLQMEKKNEKVLEGQQIPKPDAKKSKKMTHKCLVCGVQGNKLQMKKCKICKHYTHRQCLTEQAKPVFVCHKCSINKTIDLTEEKEIAVPVVPEEKNQQEKAAKKRKKKEKKIEEIQLFDEKFKENHPYYFDSNGSVKFPIEDKLLYLRPQIFAFPSIKPLPSSHPKIPSPHLGNALYIQNFISTYESELSNGNPLTFSLNDLYESLSIRGTDQIFQFLLVSILKIYLVDLEKKTKAYYEKVREIPFFYLLCSVFEAKWSEDSFIAMAARGIVGALGQVPTMGKYLNEISFPDKLNAEKKLQILAQLIKGLNQVVSFHRMVQKNSERIPGLVTTRVELREKISRTHKEIMMLKQAQKNSEQKLDSKSLAWMEANQETIREYSQRVMEIGKELHFINSNVKFLGKDRNGCCYFLFAKETNRIYVESQEKDKSIFKIYETVEKITEFSDSLNTKGVHEKRLYETIFALIKEGVITDESKNDTKAKRMANELCSYVQKDIDFREKIIKDLLGLQSKFSDYLAIIGYRWASDSKRGEFRFGLPYITDFEVLKSQVSYIQTSFSSVEPTNEANPNLKLPDSSSYSSQEKVMDPYSFETQKQNRKSIRIWGFKCQKKRNSWIEYLTSCGNFSGLWISVRFLCEAVQDYVEKKLAVMKENQRKEELREQRRQKWRKIGHVNRKKRTALQRLSSESDGSLPRLRIKTKKSYIFKRSKKRRQDPCPEPTPAEPRKSLRPSTKSNRRIIESNSDYSIESEQKWSSSEQD